MKKSLFTAVLFAALISSLFAQDAPVVEAPAAEATAVEQVKAIDAEKLEQRDKLAELLQSDADPFRLMGSGSSGANVATMVDLSQLIHAVQIKGILKMEGKEPLAMFCLGDKSPRQFVREGEFIVIPQTMQRIGNKMVAPKNYYLVVKEILDNSVVVAPQERPQEQVTIR